MRLDKFLVECGVGTRSEVKKILKAKVVRVNNEVVTLAKQIVDEQQDYITYKEEPLHYEKYVYYMLNKPKGVISATSDNKHATVVELLDDVALQKEVFPVGRLDIDTHGLLLLTNNGALAHALLSPKKHVEKVYQATVSGVMTEEDVLAFQAGIQLEDGTNCLPAKLEILSQTPSSSVVRITVMEGKFHQVKRMVQAVGKRVTDLKRLSMGELQLDETLKKGEWRRLTATELALFEAYAVEL